MNERTNVKKLSEDANRNRLMVESNCHMTDDLR